MAGSNQVGRTGEADRDLARTLLTAPDQIDAAFIGHKHGAASVMATRAELERSLTTLAHYEPKLDGSLASVPRRYLNVIGCAMRPDLSADQAQAWTEAMMFKLSDLPPHVLAKATERAAHVAFEFPSEVEAKVRELAAEHVERIKRAIRLAMSIEAALREAANPTRTALPAEPTLQPGERVIDDATVQKLQRGNGLGQAVLQLGIAKGWVLPEQLADDDTTTQED